MSRRARDQWETMTLHFKGTRTISLPPSPSAEAAVWTVPGLHMKENHWQILGHMPKGQGSVITFSGDGSSGRHLFFFFFYSPSTYLAWHWCPGGSHVWHSCTVLAPLAPPHGSQQTHPAQPTCSSHALLKQLPAPSHLEEINEIKTK